MERFRPTPFSWDIARFTEPNPFEKPLEISQRVGCIIDSVRTLIDDDDNTAAYSLKDELYTVFEERDEAWIGVCIERAKIERVDIDPTTEDENVVYGDEMRLHLLQMADGSTRILIESEKYNFNGVPYSADISYLAVPHRPTIQHAAEGFDCAPVTKRQFRIEAEQSQYEIYVSLATLLGNVEKTIEELKIFAANAALSADQQNISTISPINQHRANLNNNYSDTPN